MSIQWALRMLPDLLPEDLLARLQSTSVDPYYVFPEAGNSMSVFDASCGERVKVCMVLPAKCSPRIFLKNAILSSRRPSVARQSGKAGIAPQRKDFRCLRRQGSSKARIARDVSAQTLSNSFLFEKARSGWLEC